MKHFKNIQNENLSFSCSVTRIVTSSIEISLSIYRESNFSIWIRSLFPSILCSIVFSSLWQKVCTLEGFFFFQQNELNFFSLYVSMKLLAFLTWHIHNCGIFWRGSINLYKLYIIMFLCIVVRFFVKKFRKTTIAIDMRASHNSFFCLIHSTYVYWNTLNP